MADTEYRMNLSFLRPWIPLFALLLSILVEPLRAGNTFAFEQGDTVAVLGNGLADRMQHDGWLETLIQTSLPEKKLRFRCMATPADDVWHSYSYMKRLQYLEHVKPEVVFIFYGYNESFGGVKKIAVFRDGLTTLIQELGKHKLNGISKPRVVVFSPIAHENLNDPRLPDGTENNVRLRRYTEEMRAVCAAEKVSFVDLFALTKKVYAGSEKPLTINGIHPSNEGNRRLGAAISDVLDLTPATDEKRLELVREKVLDKNWHWHARYRARSGNDVWGGRAKLSYVNKQSNGEVLMHELDMLDVLTANRDEVIWAAAKGKSMKPDDSNVPPPVPVISNVGPEGGGRFKHKGLKYLSGEEGIGEMRLASGFKAQLFADESRFPKLSNPVQMQVDGSGRVWTSCWAGYPMWKPMTEMSDAILIFEDDDKDGKADRCIEFAKISNPLAFEFWNGGVVVASQPDIWFLKDTDGDDIADEKVLLLQGLGSADTHHAANNFLLGTDGALYWQSGYFLQNRHETPWGPPLVVKASGLFRFDPDNYTVSFLVNNGPNPHGICQDYWGNFFISDGTSGRGYHLRTQNNGFATYPLYKRKVRPITGIEIVSSTHFPDDFQQNLFKSNTLGYRGIKYYKLHRNGYTREYDGQTTIYKPGEVAGVMGKDFLVSGDENFRPTDMIFGDDGSLYVSDWQNVIIGHMQHNLRDPNRDHQHGRIYRIVHENRPLQSVVKIAGASIAGLLENLTHPVDSVRHRTRNELRVHKKEKVIEALDLWVKQWNPNDEKEVHHLVEALWVNQQFHVRNQDLLDEILQSKVLHAQNAAAMVNHFWTVADPTKALREQAKVVKEKPEKIIEGGVLSQSDSEVSVRVVCLPEKLKFDFTRFEVKPGQNVRVEFVNPDFMPHNLLFLRGKSGDDVAKAAIALQGEGFKKDFIPESEDIIAYTRLLEKGEEQVLKFNAPEDPGEHEFICSFPGHSMLMRGVMVVR